MLNEEELLKFQKEKENKDKLLLNIEIVLGLVSVAMFIIIVCVAEYIMEELKVYTIPIITIILGFISMLVALGFCVLIEQKAGFYKCKHCGHKHVPTYNKICWSMHVGRIRYIKCPKCKQKSWQKKVLK